MKTVHIAAQAVIVNGRTIQRCAICGMKLIDSQEDKASKEALEAASGMLGGMVNKMDRIPTWDVGTVVEEEDECFRRVYFVKREGGDTYELGHDCCIDLVE